MAQQGFFSHEKQKLESCVKFLTCLQRGWDYRNLYTIYRLHVLAWSCEFTYTQLTCLRSWGNTFRCSRVFTYILQQCVNVCSM